MEQRDSLDTFFELHAAYSGIRAEDDHIDSWCNDATYIQKRSTATKFAIQHGGRIFSVFRGYNQSEILDKFTAHDGFKAALVRDPLRSVASSFHELMSRGYCKGEKCESASSTNQSELTLILKHILATTKDAHFAPQMHFLVDEKGRKLALDYIGLTDDLGKELEFISRIPGSRAQVGYQSGPKKGNQHATEFRIDVRRLPIHVVRRICEVYAVDYCCLGFEFPPACRNMFCDHFFRS